MCALVACTVKCSFTVFSIGFEVPVWSLVLQGDVSPVVQSIFHIMWLARLCLLTRILAQSFGSKLVFLTRSDM